MYYQRKPVRYHLRPYQQDTEEGKMTPQHSARMRDSLFRSMSAVESPGNFAVINSAIQTSHQPQMGDIDGLHRLWNDGHGGTPAPESRMTSYPHDVTRQRDERPQVLPPPGPYDCKPPYSYISLIAMAIESSPNRRFVCLHFVFYEACHIGVVLTSSSI